MNFIKKLYHHRQRKLHFKCKNKAINFPFRALTSQRHKKFLSYYFVHMQKAIETAIFGNIINNFMSYMVLKSYISYVIATEETGTLKCPI